MSGDTATAPETRLYGNWRRARGFGIGQLGTGQTVTVFGVVVAPILAAYVSARAALVLGLIGAVIVGLVVVRVGGSTAAEIILRRVRFTLARSAGYTELAGGVLTEHPRKADRGAEGFGTESGVSERFPCSEWVSRVMCVGA